MNSINYGLLSRARDFYEKEGFQYIEVPWLVSGEISDITCPAESSTYVVQKNTEKKTKAFIASGEQGFLHLINRGNLPKSGKFQTITPCLRNDVWGNIHWKQFVKLELIEYGPHVYGNGYDGLMSAASAFMLQEAGNVGLDIVRASDGLSADLEYNGIELGSYGMRSCFFTDWYFGTGVAEPRFSRTFKIGA